ncbi:class I SAM-dependent methyltransferase [Alcanivorax sp.]|jgi:16S rRNA (guanine1516-N2)-methyltransferase|uniref:class I SAM-dependent methyltransferase n=1 Tax=Alcanivorax sp. TaxID=1872427 RepID=UPI0032D96EBC
MTLSGSLDAILGLLPGCPEGLPGRPVDSEALACAAELELVLGWHNECLSLWRPQGKETPLTVSFCEGKQGYRLTSERVRHERLIKALGKPKNDRNRVVDATAGLGRDAALMAQAGFQVLLAERSPVLHAMLADGLQRAPAGLAANMELLGCEDSRTRQVSDLHAVYLDPMFPAREKSAAVKKDLQWLQRLCAYPDADEEHLLLAWARGLEPARVVVKRPVKAGYLAGVMPSFSQKGKAVRFDIYTCP